MTNATGHFAGTWIPASFNYTNLALTPVPLSVYLDQPSCYDSFCSTIFTDYRPVLSVPQQILSLDPAWSSCDVYWGGLYDPPKALQPAQAVLGPTTPAGNSQASSTSAVPESSLLSPTVKPTTVSGDPPQIATATQNPSSTDLQSPSDPHIQPSATSPVPSKPLPGSADPVQPDAVQIDSEVAKPPPNTESRNNRSSSTAGQFTTTQASGDGTSISDPGADTKDGSHAPSNAAEVFSEAQQDQTDDNSRPIVTFSGADGHQHSGVLTGGNVIVDSTVTISQEGAKSSVTGIGVVSAADSGLVISQENVKVTAAYSSEESTGPAAAATTALITFEGSTYTVVQSSRIGAQEASFESHSVEAATFEAGGNVFTAYRPEPDGAVRVIAEEITFSLERGSATNIDDHSISADPTGKLAFDDENLAYTVLDQSALPSSSGVIFTANDKDMYTVVQNSGTDLFVHNAGSTFTIPASSAATVGGSEIRLGASDYVLVDSETLAPSALPSASAGQQVEFTVDGKIRTATEQASDSAAVFDGTTVSVGGPALTLGDETVSMATGGLVLQSNGKQDTITFAQAQAQDTTAILTLGANGMTAYAFGSDVTAAPSGIILDGTTLLVGGSVVTISGNTVSLASSGIVIANDGSTSTTHLPTASSLPESKAVLTLGSRTFTAYQAAQSPGVVEIGGTRISVGGDAITIDGDVVSAVSSGIVEDGTLVSWSTIHVPAMTSDTPGSASAGHGAGTTQRSRTSAESPATQRDSGIATTTSGAERHRVSVVRMSLVAVGLVFVTLI
ncbi:hypothetical protein KC343_g3978 [Hortaea werneckii]|nr:hypothetical protein KC352_g8029 [Hortaea werneckii]KAI7565925.1 hypothetical protein KC317_g6021 [Hortaea werneckii]KAI7624624.1 hypothetical protein KC346_g2137 [Hortaea werneckii]KAI7631512.1 hypothetical protein KC343_g3978 [Hortaea werneckii]KAI7677757.1 hypothetical protein KC319_g3724 [Hortaea werneckii]